VAVVVNDITSGASEKWNGSLQVWSPGRVRESLESEVSSESMLTSVVSSGMRKECIWVMSVIGSAKL